MTIAVDDTQRVSGLLQAPQDARACYVLAHGAGAGMAHPFMAAVADGPRRARHRHAALSVSVHGARLEAAGRAEACPGHRPRRGRGSGAAGSRACRCSPAASPSAAA